MDKKKYIELTGNPVSLKLETVPVLEYSLFSCLIDHLMKEEGIHCLAYFVFPDNKMYRFICCMGRDSTHTVLLFSHEMAQGEDIVLDSITANHFQFHVFEREIHENYGIKFNDHPWLKPVRYPFDRFNRMERMKDYPFFSIDGGELHEVGVGPVHAGVIEPGHFRFICHGENVIHLEIQLGYQHRGIEKLFIEKSGILQQTILAESIAGDTAIGHAIAYSSLIETLAALRVSPPLAMERTIALELERIAFHIGDTAAICADIAYQFGQVVNEALRTVVINTTQSWCGNRFGKGLTRPGGTRYPLTPEIIALIRKNLKDVEESYLPITERIFSLSSVLSRFEGIGKVTSLQASMIGAVGMAARSSNLQRDIRWSHPFAAFQEKSYKPVVLSAGDVWSRVMLRKMEVVKSLTIIRELLEDFPIEGFHKSNGNNSIPHPGKRQNGRSGNPGGSERNDQPVYNLTLEPASLSISMVEGWRGEICHVAVTDENGKIVHYKIKDPSFHNWMALALAVRNQEISDFPLCNKSFNLSYCGNDL